MNSDSPEPIRTESIMRSVRNNVELKKIVTGSHLPSPPGKQLPPSPNNDSLPSSETHVELPEFSRKNGYAAEELLRFNDKAFIRCAYLAALNRDPDIEGSAYYLEQIRLGRLEKIEVLGRLRYSAEGRRQGVTIKGLTARFALRLAMRIPVLGYVLESAWLLFTLPSVARKLRALEAALHEETSRLTEMIEAHKLQQLQATHAIAKALDDHLHNGSGVSSVPDAPHEDVP
ncbi:DUF4214 domain-containing protein [Methyloterricola oryzae]|uniref:DUF4214 domain-containing protein n=1 Tax=Methyloterricola oryzae TaxID=1495050 RepID=UPI0009E4CCB9|nr:DUF4214 domain-containing protein [Methyloterricola oryzae]